MDGKQVSMLIRWSLLRRFIGWMVIGIAIIRDVTIVTVASLDRLQAQPKVGIVREGNLVILDFVAAASGDSK
jgi:hypothetical protein